MCRVIVIATDAILAFHEDLVAKGVFFKLPPTESLDGTQAMFRDPDGNAFVLWERSPRESARRGSGDVQHSFADARQEFSLP